jgi:tetratricopeptide (TPR) repeat protein
MRTHRPLTLVFFAVLASSAVAEPLPTAKWLVDLGRDYPLTPQAGLSNTDAEIAILFMQAAARVDPKLAEPWLWLYDLQSALGREADAIKSLGQYVRLDPQNVWAQLTWIDLAAGSLQTAEQRGRLFEALLKREDVPAAVAADLHRRLAEHYWNRGDRKRAEAEIAAASRDNPDAASIRILADTIRDVPNTPALRVLHLLDSLQRNPADVSLAAQLGEELLACGLPTEAERMFGHAIRIVQLIPSGPTPPELLLADATALVDAGQLDRAQTIAQGVAKADARNSAAYLLLARIARKRGDEKTAAKQAVAAGQVWRDVLASKSKVLDPRVTADMAWFFAAYGIEPVQAEKLARAVLVEDPTNVVALRALGAAQVRSGRGQEAIATLKPIADRDTWAAIDLARAEVAASQQKEASGTLRAAATQPANGEQRDELAAIARQAGVSLPATRPAAGDEISQALAAFPAAVLDYPFHPDKYLSVELTASAAELTPTQPWLCTATLKNIGPFPITLGPQAMVVPEMLCSIATHGDRDRTSGPSQRILLNRVLQIPPGGKIATTQNLLIGPIRASMIGTPQVTQEVEVSGLLNPIRLVTTDGREVWAPGVGGLLATPLRFRRTAFIAGPDDVQRLIGESSSGGAEARIEATQMLAMLFAEHQHLAAGRLSYSTRRINAAAVEAAVLARTSDGDWQVRARLAEFMRWFILDRTASQASTKLLGDANWLVRGLTIRMLADQFTAKPDSIRPALTKYSTGDPDEWVRALAAALLARGKTTATAPAAASAGAAAPTAGSPPAAAATQPAAALPKPPPLLLPE